MLLIELHKRYRLFYHVGTRWNAEGGMYLLSLQCYLTLQQGVAKGFGEAGAEALPLSGLDGMHCKAHRLLLIPIRVQ